MKCGGSTYRLSILGLLVSQGGGLVLVIASPERNDDKGERGILAATFTSEQKKERKKRSERGEVPAPLRR